MKNLLTRSTVAALVAFLGLAAIPSTSYAGRVVYHGPHRTYGYHYGHGPNYGVVYGNGWHGRGYYYGPVGVRYYYRTPGVVFYPTRVAVPASYEVVSAPAPATLEVNVQNELASQGYYKGPIDGDIGPGSRSAISSYQANNGLKVTGTINNALLKSLGLN